MAITTVSAAVSATPRPAFKGEWVSWFVFPALSVAALLGVWEILIRLLDVPLWLVPKPSDFLARMFTDFALIAGHAWATENGGAIIPH